jgi:hypothetical protein
MSSVPEEKTEWGWVGGGPVLPLRRVTRRARRAGTAASGARHPAARVGEASADQPAQPFPAAYNVVAGFRRVGAARSALRLLHEHGVPPEAMTVDNHSAGDSDEEIAALRSEMQSELGEGWASPAALVTADQGRGALGGALLGGLVFMFAGLVVGVLWAVGFRSGPPVPVRIVSLVVISGLAGGTVGLLAGGGLAPRRSELTPAAERDVLVAVHSDDRPTVEYAAKVLTELGAERVDLVDGSGTPLPPQYAHPRPADPPGWWWRRAGRG